MDQQSTSLVTTSPPPPVYPQPGVATEPAPPAVPTEWPGAWGLFTYSKRAVKFNLKTLLVLYILNLLISGLVSHASSGVRLIGGVVTLVIGIASYFGYLAGVRWQRLSIGKALRKCEPLLVLKYIVCIVAMGLTALISLLLLIVPFFFVLPRIVLAPYFLIDKKQGPIEAIKTSWAITKGHIGKVWGIIGASIAMVLLCVTIIGIPFALYFLFMYSAALALLYEFLTQTTPVALPNPPASEPGAAVPTASDDSATPPQVPPADS